MAPVILGPREPERPRFGGFTFHQRHAPHEGALWQPTRLYWPDPFESPIIEPGIGDMPFNPVRPAWRDFPYPEEVPYPARMPSLARWFDGGNGHVYLTDPRYFTAWAEMAPGWFGPSFIDTERSIRETILGLYGAVDDGSRAPFMATRGDEQSTVPADTIETLVDLAREGNRDDFMFLAGASGVRPEQHEELWAGTRKRLGLP